MAKGERWPLVVAPVDRPRGRELRVARARGGQAANVGSIESPLRKGEEDRLFYNERATCAAACAIANAACNLCNAGLMNAKNL